MYSISLLVIFCRIFVSQGTYYHPAIIWDLNNPILQKQYWTNVVQVNTFDEVTFICAHEVLSMSGHDSKAYNSKLKNSLYVKEISPDTTDFDHACSSQGAKLLKNCDNPKTLTSQAIQINTIQAQPALPTFVKGKDYMFFANSNGTEESLTTSTNKCTMVFRIHFCAENEECSRSSCFLMGRKKVCEVKTNSKTHYSGCIPSAPWAVQNTKSTNTTMDISWKEPNTGCNITYYSICYRASTEKNCKEILVRSTQRSVILKKLSPSVEYKIRVGAHFCSGHANYSEEIHGNTTASGVFENKTLDPATPKPKTKSNTDTKPTNPATNPTTNPTTNYTEHTNALPQTGAKTMNFDPTSVAIGIVLGVVITLACVIGIWFLCKVRRREDKNCSVDHETAVKFDQEIDSIKISTNSGYRESVSNTLPKVIEDDTGEKHSLYVSEA